MTPEAPGCAAADRRPPFATDSLFVPLVFGSVVVDVIAVVGVLPASATIYSAAAASWALFSGKSGVEVAEQAAFGLAVGFIVGIPLMICAGLALALGS